MSKFWYQLVDEKANVTVKLSAKDSVIFSKRLVGQTEFLLEENAHLDELVKITVLRKLSESEKKALNGKAPKAVPAAEVTKPVVEAPKPVVTAPPVEEKPVDVAPAVATLGDIEAEIIETGEEETKKKSRKK